ncbi:flagellar assembly peptidoglycan hydrolase FlgJ [Curvibacter sp. CHRR-16]|uniref:flagellar assembly peptidoglycan hydrolase FlgJ n=1 Tax=Curvibacter sp. CHRR-16 TaxID=2835872 RepID=UPI001BDB58DA|nr:flagellar assembly peptidoglycan hydrolase FlgJ [Curvibacter sp. CHRR-16]MBT0569553.1 flagellar assembly peptidoglycan hydrolase FlgJ [Curvibacter sp. CHRR-16]
MSVGMTPGFSGSLNNRDMLATDVQSLDKLKYAAGAKTPEAIRETAKQFESLFMRELLKSMRDANASMKSGMLDNEGTNLGNDLLDQQFAVQMSGQRGGLADIIAKQLAQQAGVSLDGSSTGVGKAAPAASMGPAATGSVGAVTSTTSIYSRQTTTTTAALSASALAAYNTRTTPTQAQRDFVTKHQNTAARIERESGIPASFMLGQAGHETGWGKREIRTRTGENSHNLFGIKAGPNWKGRVAEVHTTEYINGVPHRQVARFRAYNSFEEGFRDYARLINESPRYAKVRNQMHSAQGFANGLQKAGYATDPAYGAKLSRAIHTTLNIQRVQV